MGFSPASPRLGHIRSLVLVPLTRFVWKRSAKVIPIKHIEIGQHLEDYRVARGHHFYRKLSSMIARTKIFSDLLPSRFGACRLRVIHLLEFLKRFSHPNATLEFPVFPVIPEFMTTLALYNPTAFLSCHHVKFI